MNILVTFYVSAQANGHGTWVFLTESKNELIILEPDQKNQIGYSLYRLLGNQWTQYNIEKIDYPRNLELKVYLENGGYLQLDAGLSPSLKSEIQFPKEKLKTITSRKRVEYFFKHSDLNEYLIIEINRKIRKVTLLSHDFKESYEIKNLERFPDGGTQVITLDNDMKVRIPSFVFEDKTVIVTSRNGDISFYRSEDLKKSIRLIMEKEILAELSKSCQIAVKSKK